MKFGKIKKTICILLAGTMVLGTSLTAFASEQTPADGTETYTNVSEMAKFTFKGYNNGTLPTPTTTLGLLEYTLKTGRRVQRTNRNRKGCFKPEWKREKCLYRGIIRNGINLE